MSRKFEHWRSRGSRASPACWCLPWSNSPRCFWEASQSPRTFSARRRSVRLSIGHEYTDRTLSLLLTLPARRERLFAIKLGVLAVMLLTLWLSRPPAGVRRLPASPEESASMAALLPVLCGLFLAPWLTMALPKSDRAAPCSRSAIPGVLLVAGELIGSGAVRTTDPTRTRSD